MKITKIYTRYSLDSICFLHQWFGMLLVKNRTESNLLSSKCRNAYQKVLNPFELHEPDNIYNVPVYGKYVEIYAKVLVFICKHSFLLARFFYLLPFRPTFKTTQDSITVFRAIFPEKQQRTLCLPRVFFVIATSKSFKKSGVGFIGVFLPSRKLHAWIIEKNTNPDPYDDIWICYQPVAAIHKG